MTTPIGLRVDVDTFRGTRLGVPELCRIMERYSIKASYFFSVGPDNMGRHLWRLLRPAFLLKMLRSKAASLYGWDILLRGTLWAGPIIGLKLPSIIRACSDQGHEIGLHAWDHHAWQHRIESADAKEIRETLRKAVDLLDSIGVKPVCAASPAWRTTDEVLRVKAGEFPNFIYNSDCRGEGVFLPVVDGKAAKQPQVPINLPTYDEVLGRNGINAGNYNDHLLSQLRPEAYNALTIHAEVEGIIAARLFEDFIIKAGRAGYHFVPLSGLIPADVDQLPNAPIEVRSISGREGWISLRA